MSVTQFPDNFGWENLNVALTVFFCSIEHDIVYPSSLIDSVFVSSKGIDTFIIEYSNGN